MQPIITTYTKNRGLYAMRMHPDRTRFVKVTDSALHTFNSSQYADFVIGLSDPYNLGVYGGVPPTMALDFKPVDVIFERQFVDDGMGGLTLQAATFGDPAVGNADTTEGVDLFSIRGGFAAAVNLAASAGTIVVGAAITGTLTDTQMTTNLTDVLDTLYTGRVIIFTSGNLKNMAAVVIGYDATTKKLTYAKLPVAPVNGDGFVIV